MLSPFWKTLFLIFSFKIAQPNAKLFSYMFSYSALIGSVARPLVFPKGWAGAEVGIGMVLVVAMPLIENQNKIQMFKFL